VLRELTRGTLKTAARREIVAAHHLRHRRLDGRRGIAL